MTENNSPATGSLTVKDIYTEIGLNYRYFLTWRHSLFAGYLVVCAGLAVGASWCFKEAPGYLWLIPLAAILLTAVFWMIERRNRDLYRTCLVRGAQCEATLHECGIYVGFRLPPPSAFTQSFAIDFFFGAVLFLLIAGALVLGFNPVLLSR